MKILICHPGTQYSPYLAVQLHQHGKLLYLYTGIALGEDHFIIKVAKYLPLYIRNRITSRIISNLPDHKIKRNILIEAKALFNAKNNTDEEYVLYKRNKKFQEDIKDNELKKADIVIGYDTSSWILAKRCKELDIPFILDVSIGHPISKNKIYHVLSKKYPNWANSLQIKNDYLIQLEQKEHLNASLIVAPSSYVKNTFIENGITPQLIKVNPFGTDTNTFLFKLKKHSERIKFLFFGGLTVRKGLPLLLSVWERNYFQNAELTIAGFGELPHNYQLPPNVKNKGKIPLNSRNKLFSDHDVFIFPSNFEGFAQVQIEAAACGLPIISTANAGGNEIVKNGINGFIIEHENEKMLKEAIENFIHIPELLHRMSNHQRTIMDSFSWEAYGRRWLNILEQF